MGRLVSHKTGAVTAAFPTFEASVGLLSSVNSLVGVEVSAVTEAFLTLEALEGLLTHVCPLTGNEGGGLTEASHARVTPVGSLCLSLIHISEPTRH